eukprot:5203965-Amphidinium_carterae.1
MQSHKEKEAYQHKLECISNAMPLGGFKVDSCRNQEKRVVSRVIALQQAVETIDPCPCDNSTGFNAHAAHWAMQNQPCELPQLYAANVQHVFHMFRGRSQIQKGQIQPNSKRID